MIWASRGSRSFFDFFLSALYWNTSFFSRNFNVFSIFIWPEPSFYLSSSVTRCSVFTYFPLDPFLFFLLLFRQLRLSFYFFPPLLLLMLMLISSNYWESSIPPILLIDVKVNFDLTYLLFFIVLSRLLLAFLSSIISWLQSLAELNNF